MIFSNVKDTEREKCQGRLLGGLYFRQRKIIMKKIHLQNKTLIVNYTCAIGVELRIYPQSDSQQITVNGWITKTNCQVNS